MAQGMWVDLFDLAALRYGLQSDLKTLWVKIGSPGGREQQIVGVGPITVSHSKDMPDQQLTEAIRNSGFPIGAFGFGRALDNQVCFLCGIIVEDFDIGVVQRKCACRNTKQIFVHRQRLPLGIEVRDLQGQQFADAVAHEQVGQNGDSLSFLHDFLNKDLHLIRAQNPHFPLDNLRAGCA